MDFINFHNHSEFSFLASLLKVENLVGYASFYGYQGCALSDTLSTFGFFELTKCCERENIKPIYGIEVFVKGISGKGHYSLLLFALSNRGLKNLFALNTLIHQTYRKTGYYAIPFDVLCRYRDGLAVMMESEIYFYLMRKSASHHPDVSVEKILSRYYEAFGDNFYVEVNYQGDKKLPFLRSLTELIVEYGLKGIATAETRYYIEDKASFDFLNDIRQKTHHKTERGLPLPVDLDYSLKKPLELIQIFKNHPSFLHYNEELFQTIEAKLDVHSLYIPQLYRDKGILSRICNKNLKKLGLDERYQKRLDYELGVIKNLHLEDYFLIVYQMMRFVRINRIPFGYGRGSAVSSLVVYLLGITKVDPLEYNLLFERFLNPSRKQMPDIDLDICYRRRGEVFQFVKEKFGEERVCLLATIDRLKARSVIREVSKSYKLEKPKQDKILSLIPPYRDFSVHYLLKHAPEFGEFYREDREVHEFIDIVLKIEGIAAHSSVHAGGVLIAPKGVVQFASVEVSQSAERVAQLTKEDIEDTGFIKIDILGLRFVTIIEDVFRLVGRRDIDFNDSFTYNVISEGDTTCIFQLESSGMKALLRKIKPQNIAELSDVIALYRPGPIQSGMTEMYVKRRNSESAWESDERIASITAETYGLFVYQEQILQIARQIANMDWERADILRKALSSKDNNRILSMKEEFVGGCQKNGYSLEGALQLFGILVDFGSYGFNKSHSVAYAYNAYIGAYCKTHFPLAFYIASLNANIGDVNRQNRYLSDIKFHRHRFGIGILPMDINKSGVLMKRENDSIRAGLILIKYVGKKLALAIVTERKSHGHYKDLLDFCIRMKGLGLNSRALEYLIKAGAFDSFSIGREAHLTIAHEVLKVAHKLSSSQEDSLFGTEENPTLEYFLKKMKVRSIDSSPETNHKLEYEATDLFISYHPLDNYSEFWNELEHNRLEELENLTFGVFVVYFHKMRVVKTKSGGLMVVGQLYDGTDNVECIIYPRFYHRYAHVIKNEKCYLVKGRVGEKKIFPEEIYLLDELKHESIKL